MTMPCWKLQLHYLVLYAYEDHQNEGEPVRSEWNGSLEAHAVIIPGLQQTGSPELMGLTHRLIV